MAVSMLICCVLVFFHIEKVEAKNTKTPVKTGVLRLVLGTGLEPVRTNVHWILSSAPILF